MPLPHTVQRGFLPAPSTPHSRTPRRIIPTDRRARRPRRAGVYRSRVTLTEEHQPLFRAGSRGWSAAKARFTDSSLVKPSTSHLRAAHRQVIAIGAKRSVAIPNRGTGKSVYYVAITDRDHRHSREPRRQPASRDLPCRVSSPRQEPHSDGYYRARRSLEELGSPSTPCWPIPACSGRAIALP